jgi:hypothetical protein
LPASETGAYFAAGALIGSTIVRIDSELRRQDGADPLTHVGKGGAAARVPGATRTCETWWAQSPAPCSLE